MTPPFSVEVGYENQRLEKGEMQVWCADLDLYRDSKEIFRAILSLEEMAKARSFHFAQDETRFLVAHGLLRRILAYYVPVKPEHLTFAANPYGKPALTNVPNKAALHFNMSHSRHLAVYAFARTEIGVDVECVHRVDSMNAIMQRHFSSKEASALSALPIESRWEGFFRCWTRREACIKALGLSLSFPPDLTVPITPKRSSYIVRVANNPGQERLFWMKDIDVGEGAVAAVAAPNESYRVRILKCTKS